jgi:hypothetical protein
VSLGHPLADSQLAAIIAASALLAAFGGAEPTGGTIIDLVLVVVTAGLVTWASARAPWWAVASAAGVAGAIALSPLLTTLALAACFAGLWAGWFERTDRALYAAIGAVSVNVLIRSQLNDPFGLSALVGLLTCAMLLIVGIAERDARVRRRSIQIGAAAAGVFLIAAVVSGLSLQRSRQDLEAGQRLAQDGFDMALAGDYATAAELFNDAASSFERAAASIDHPLTYVAQVAPVVAQHHRAASEIVQSGSASLADSGVAVDSIAAADLGVKDGSINLDEIRSTFGPLRQLEESLASLNGSVTSANTEWLLPVAGSRLDELSDELATLSSRLDDLVRAIESAPALLGEDGPRTYFVGFTTPAEARGIGGLMGNFAEIQVDNGRISLTDFGRATDLNGDQDAPSRRVIDGPEDFVQRYGGYGFVKPDGATGSTPWSNITMPADFRLAADVIAQLYPQSGGRTVDGVIVLDAFALDALAGFGGPLPLPNLDKTLEPGEVASFLLYSQYELEFDGRVDLLEDVARATLDRLLGGHIPPLPQLGSGLLPLAQQDRIVAWMADDEEQELIERLGLSGRLPALEGADGVAVTVNNASANKIDAYLERTIEHVSVLDPATGRVQSTTTVTITNTAPASGLPFIVIGNEIGAPIGTNRTLLSVYTAGSATAVTVSGEAVPFVSGTESGWSVVDQFVILAAGDSTTMTVSSEAYLDLTDGYELVAHPQPLVLPAELTVELGLADKIEDITSVVHEPGFVVEVDVFCPYRVGTIDIAACEVE